MPHPHTILSLLLLAAGPAAQAMSNVSAPSDWRFDSSSLFNGVNFDGVARLDYTRADGRQSMCSGTLLSGGLYVLTAAHCVDGMRDFSVQFGINSGVATTTRGVADAIVHEGWNGGLMRGNDIAILKLDDVVTGIAGFGLHRQSAMGQSVLMMGYGTTAVASTTAAPAFTDLGHGHWGMNTFDATSQQFMDAARADGVPYLFDTSNVDGEEYVADFDSGLSVNNTLGRFTGLSSGLGGPVESLITGGDSGGGDFVWTGSQWLLTGVHSWGWEFCEYRLTPSCDAVYGNSGSFGDLMGSTAVYSHADWISAVTGVPEPGTWALMALGLGAVAARARRPGARAAAEA
jgi:hypothetical protein